MNSGLLVSVLVGGLGIGGAVGYMAGAATRNKAPVAEAGSSGSTSNSAWFVFDGQTYDTATLPSGLQSSLYQVDLEGFNQKQAQVREFVVRLALAKEQNKFTSLDKLPPLEELLPAATATDEEAKQFFEANKDRVPPGTTFEQLSGRIKEILANEKRVKTFNATLEKLQADGKFKMVAKEPTPPIVDIPVANFPSRGSANGPHTLVEISDYLCPHCQQMAPQVKALAEKHANKMKYVQINFALRPTQLSGTMVEGGFCAQKQGTDAFWKYHEAAFSKAWGTFADNYDVAKVKPVAEAAGLNVKDWEACMASNEPKEWMQKTRDLVNNLGVTGTPTFYLNNKRINLHNAEELSKLIEGAVAGS